MTTTPHDALLEHRAFLLRLARSLVRDESTAQDVVQDASAAYLTSPPSSDDSAKAWLARVVRRLAGKSHRSRARTKEREAAVARQEWEPSGIDRTDQRLDAQSTLIEHLKSLPDSQREAVVLRYHEDMAPSAIAEQIGVPVSTVHTRIQRALVSLRESMDRSAGGCRDRWATALLPAPMGMASAGALVGSAPVGAALWPYVACGLAASAVLAGIYFGFLAGGHGTTPVAELAATSTTAAQEPDALTAIAPGARTLADADDQNIAGPSAPEDPGNWIIPVTVTGEGVAVKPMMLRIKGVNGYNWMDKDDITVSMDAPGTGAIDLRELIQSRQYVFSPVTGLVIRAEHPDCPSQTVELTIAAIPDRETAPAEPSAIELNLPLSSVVAGRITLTGSGIATDARVFAFPATGESGTLVPRNVRFVGKATPDAQGEFRLRMAHDGPIAVVTVANGHRPQTRMVSVDRGETRTLPTMTLSPGNEITGRLMWNGEAVPTGTRLTLDTVEPGDQWNVYFEKPLQAYRLAWEEGRFEVSATAMPTDAEGRFAISGLGTRPLSLTLNDLRPFQTFHPVLAESVSAPANLDLELGAALMEVHFEFEGEVPQSGYTTAVLQSGDDNPPSEIMQVTGVEVLHLPVPPGLEVEFTTQFDGFSPATVRRTAPQAAGETLTVTIPVQRDTQVAQLNVSLSIDGALLEDGTPVQLELLPQGAVDWDRWVTRGATASGGVAFFGELPTGFFDARVYPGRSTQWRSTLRVDAQLQLELEPRRTVELAHDLAPGGKALFQAKTTDGRLVAMQYDARILNASGEPVESHFRTVDVATNASWGGWTAVGPVERMSSLPVGSYTLELRHPDFAPVDQSFAITKDETTDVDVVLAPIQ